MSAEARRAAWPTERWLDEPAAAAVGYAQYWNDVEEERGKPWWVADGDFTRLEAYLDASGLAADLDHALAVARERTGRPLGGVGLDVAAGIFWSAPRLLREPGVQRVYGLDYSRHRILELAPRVAEHYGLEPDRLVLVWGSFYELRLDEGSIDFALLSQALHHADDPDALLAELGRVLRPGAIAIVTGEHRMRWRGYARYLAGTAARRTLRLRPTGTDLYGVDAEAGDHFYTRREYRAMFARAGLTAEPVRRPGSPTESYLLRRR
jgi:ubiquinone/menaquinone biosynthesis C-methylase UbiE